MRRRAGVRALPACLACAVPSPRVRLLNRGAREGRRAEEVSANPRAESARLRAAEALAVCSKPVKRGPKEPKAP